MQLFELQNKNTLKLAACAVVNRAGMRTLAMAVIPVLLVGCSDISPIHSSMPTAAQGNDVTDAGLTMNVTDASLRKAIGPYRAWGPRATWVVVALHVAAREGRPALFDPMFQQLIIGKSNYEPDPMVAESIDDTTVSAASLRPGFEDDAVLAFLVPEYSRASAAPQLSSSFVAPLTRSVRSLTCHLTNL